MTSWAKLCMVAILDDYDNTWIHKTEPVTRLQAIRFVVAKNWVNAMRLGTVKIITLDSI